MVVAGFVVTSFGFVFWFVFFCGFVGWVAHGCDVTAGGSLVNMGECWT